MPNEHRSAVEHTPPFGNGPLTFWEGHVSTDVKGGLDEFGAGGIDGSTAVAVMIRGFEKSLLDGLVGSLGGACV